MSNLFIFEVCVDTFLFIYSTYLLHLSQLPVWYIAMSDKLNSIHVALYSYHIVKLEVFREDIPRALSGELRAD